MPLFTFKCLDCLKLIEKFVKNDQSDIICDCGSKNLEKQFNIKTNNKVWRGSQDYLENVINPEIDRMQKELENGNDNVFLDIAGDE